MGERRWCSPCSCCAAGEAAQEEDEGAITPNSVRTALSTRSSSPLRGLEERLLQLDVQRKVVVLGFRGVGKSALITRFVDGQFLDVYEPTIEYTFRTVMNRNGVRFVCDILDTSAHDEYSSLSRQASVGVHGYLLVYSSVSRTSFENVKLVQRKLLNLYGGPTVPVILVATKHDLEEYREVQEHEGVALAQRWGCPFVECSAKTNWNVELVFSTLLNTIERESGLLAEEPLETCAVL